MRIWWSEATSQNTFLTITHDFVVTKKGRHLLKHSFTNILNFKATLLESFVFFFVTFHHHVLLSGSLFFFKSVSGEVADAEDEDCLPCDEGCKQCKRSKYTASFTSLFISLSSYFVHHLLD